MASSSKSKAESPQNKASSSKSKAVEEGTSGKAKEETEEKKEGLSNDQTGGDGGDGDDGWHTSWAMIGPVDCSGRTDKENDDVDEELDRLIARVSKGIGMSEGQ
ncbi:peptidyl-prolyl cis-trans isomeraseNIMA-interacting 4, partial [Striga asiatica]